jgi:signal transduction histidine kinase
VTDLDCMSIVKTLVIAKEHWIALDLKYRLVRLGYEVSSAILNTPQLIEVEIEQFCPDLVLIETAESAIVDTLQARGLPLLCLNAHPDLPCVANPHNDLSLNTAIRETLRQQRIQLSLKQQSELLYSVDHEVRTPLSTVLITLDWLEIIEQESFSAQSCQKLEHVSLARTSVSQIAELLDRANLLCRARNNKLVWKPTRIDLQTFCKKLIASVDPSIELISTVSHCLIEFDEMILRQILSNLLNNAVKYSNSPVQLVLNCSDTQLMLQVRDSGIGISEHDRALIFTPLYRGSNVQAIPGTGMGLAIVQELVSTCQGTITVESVPNRGSTFTVILPLRPLDRCSNP